MYFCSEVGSDSDCRFCGFDDSGGRAQALLFCFIYQPQNVAFLHPQLFYLLTFVLSYQNVPLQITVGQTTILYNYSVRLAQSSLAHIRKICLRILTVVSFVLIPYIIDH